MYFERSSNKCAANLLLIPNVHLLVVGAMKIKIRLGGTPAYLPVHNIFYGFSFVERGTSIDAIRDRSIYFGLMHTFNFIHCKM